MSFLEVLSGPVKGLVDGIGGILDNLTTTDAEKLEAQRKLTELERSFQVKVLELEVERTKTQADVVKSEVASQSVLARNWRPILMLTFTYVVAHNFVIAPLFGVTMVPVPEQMWDLLQMGIGGYIGGRTVEKIVPVAVEAFRKK